MVQARPAFDALSGERVGEAERGGWAGWEEGGEERVQVAAEVVEW
jgi:hypothetical protein